MHEYWVRSLCRISICDLKAEAQKEFDFSAFNFLYRFLAICSEPKKKGCQIGSRYLLNWGPKELPKGPSFSRPLGRCEAPIAGRSSSFLALKSLAAMAETICMPALI